MQCILHVGLHHTATTTFQKFLFSNRYFLKKNKILYPLTGIYPGSYQQSQIPGCFFDDHNFIYHKKKRNLNEYLNLLQKELNEQKYDLCILSSEVFTELLQFSEEKLLLTFNELRKIFECINIFISIRSPKHRALTQLKSKLRQSDQINKFRKELFHAPDLFQKKINNSDLIIKRWKKINTNISICELEESKNPLDIYLQTIFKVLSKENKPIIKIFLKIKSNLRDIDVIHANKDPYHLYYYLLCILCGIKIKKAEEKLKKKLSFNKLKNFIDKRYYKTKSFLKEINSDNFIYLLKELKNKDLDNKNLKNILLSSGLKYSVAYFLNKIVDEFIYDLIIEK